MGERTVANNQSETKRRLTEWVIVAFVLVTAALLVAETIMTAIEYVR